MGERKERVNQFVNLLTYNWLTLVEDFVNGTNWPARITSSMTMVMKAIISTGLVMQSGLFSSVKWICNSISKFFKMQNATSQITAHSAGLECILFVFQWLYNDFSVKFRLIAHWRALSDVSSPSSAPTSRLLERLRVRVTTVVTLNWQTFLQAELDVHLKTDDHIICKFECVKLALEKQFIVR